MRGKHFKVNEGQPSSKIDRLLTKLKEAQERAVEEKITKWGFDFKNSVPA